MSTILSKISVFLNIPKDFIQDTTIGSIYMVRGRGTLDQNRGSKYLN